MMTELSYQEYALEVKGLCYAENINIYAFNEQQLQHFVDNFHNCNISLIFFYAQEVFFIHEPGVKVLK